jgi:GNAT superfamily N-acetyltransferase
MKLVELHTEEEALDRLEEHARIPIAFTVQRILAVSTLDSGLGGVVLTEAAVETPWVKDYDAIEGEGPTRWPKRFDTTNWGLIAAHDGPDRVGGAVIAFHSPGVHMLGGRSDTAALWDLRVRPDVRHTGIGSTLFVAAENWCRQRGCRVLMLETQNINLPACRFYVHMGCTLGIINRHAYSDFPDETQLVWFKGVPPLR